MYRAFFTVKEIKIWLKKTSHAWYDSLEGLSPPVIGTINLSKDIFTLYPRNKSDKAKRAIMPLFFLSSFASSLSLNDN
jgi:hypothetical protein